MPNPTTLTSDEEYPETGQYSPTDPAVVRPAVPGIEEQEEIRLDHRTNDDLARHALVRTAVPDAPIETEPGT